MDKKKIVAEIASRHGVLIREDDPAFYIVDLATMVIEEKAEEIREAIEKGEKSIPYLLDLKRKELDEAAARILAASDELEAQRKQLYETLQQDVDNELRSRVEHYTQQVIEAVRVENRESIRDELTTGATTVQAAVKDLDKARQGLSRSQLQDMLLMGAVGVIASVSTLLFYVTLFQ
jgi:exonuclease VII large subunit